MPCITQMLKELMYRISIFGGLILFWSCTDRQKLDGSWLTGQRYTLCKSVTIYCQYTVTAA